MTVSRACAGGAHMNCEWCSCEVCHFRCAQCEERCRRVYDLKERGKLCARCYLEATAGQEARGGCMRCGMPRKAYRDPRSGDSRHLCTSCHADLGHRTQEGGKWDA